MYWVVKRFDNYYLAHVEPELTRWRLDRAEAIKFTAEEEAADVGARWGARVARVVKVRTREDLRREREALRARVAELETNLSAAKRALTGLLIADADSEADPTDRESLGRLVREVWIEWAREQPDAKPSWFVPWEEMSEPDREVDRRIGERLAMVGTRSTTPPPSKPAARSLLTSPCGKVPCLVCWGVASDACPCACHRAGAGADGGETKGTTRERRC